MATRNYTAEAYEQIKKTIEEIDNTDVHPVKDFFSDLFRRLGQFLELFTVDQYKEDMQKWYDIVLDSHNSTINEVYNIFEEVGKVDEEYQKTMDGAVSSVTNFRSTLNCLRDVISGKTSLADGKAAANGYLAAGRNSLNGAYDKILTRMEAQTLVGAGKALIGDTLKLAASFCGLLVPTTPTKYASKAKGFADTFTAMLGDLGATATVLMVSSTFGIGSFFGLDRKNYLDFRFGQLTQAQNYKDTNSVSDWLGGIAEDMEETLADCPKDNPYYSIVKAAADGSRFVADTSETVDLVVDAYDILSDLKDAHETVDEWIFGKNYTVAEYTKMFSKESPWYSEYFIDGDNGPMIKVRSSPKEIVSKLFFDRIGFPLPDGNDDPMQTMGNGFKVMGTLWSYGEKMLPNPVTGQSNSDELPEVFFGKLKDTKSLKDIFDFARDLDEYSSKFDSNGAQSGSGSIKGGRYGWSLRKTGVS